MEDIQGHIALVTGAGSGINLAFAEVLYEAGASVLIADLGLTQEATDWMATTEPARVHFQRTDVTDWAQLEAAFDVAEQRFGGVVDIVTPGAGVYEPAVTTFWKDDDISSRYKVLDINLLHPIKTTRIAVKRLVNAKKPGAIIYVSSVGGQRSSLITPLYTISKHGINALTLSMAPLKDLVGIQVAAVAPGVIATPLYEHENVTKFINKEKDMMLPKEVVAKAMFALLTDKKYKSGTILEVTDFENWREVSILNDPPQGPAREGSNKKVGLFDIMQYLGGDENPNFNADDLK